VLAWLRDLYEGGTLTTSVCTGSTVLAAAGLLRNRPATTWWGALDRLAALDETIELRPDDRFVDSGEIVTAAGVSAGIDMALHLVGQEVGPEVAQAVQLGIEYDPQPPFDAGHPSKAPVPIVELVTAVSEAEGSSLNLS